MMIKKLWKKNSFKIWSITSGVLLATVIAVPIVLNTALGDVLDFALGGADPIFKEGEQSAYVKSFNSKDESKANADNVNVKLNEEGMVLLKNKNNALPIAKQSAVAPMGYGYRSPIYGGTGSGSVNTSAEWVYTPQRALGEYFNVQKDIENITLTGAAVNELLGAAGTKDAKASSFGGDNVLRDFTAASYESQAEKLNGTTGIIFISRGGGEGQDVKNDGYADGTAHKLALSKEEKATIKLAKAHC